MARSTREVASASLQWTASTDAMDAHTVVAIAAGVSTRHHRQTLDPIPEPMNEHATSRRFVAWPRKRMGELLIRPLAKFDIAVVFIAAKCFHEHCVLIVLGVDAQGNQQVLGLHEGSTENAAVARASRFEPGAGSARRLGRAGLPTERSVFSVTRTCSDIPTASAQFMLHTA